MPRFVTDAGTNGAFRYWDWDNYTGISEDVNGVTLSFNPGGEGAGRPHQAGREPFTIRLNFENAQIQEGTLDDPEATNFVAGNLTSVVFFDEGGNRMMVVNDFDLPLIILQAESNRGEDIGRFVRDFRATFDNDHFGANASDDGIDESNIRTGAGDDTVNARGGRDFIEDWGGSDFYNGGGGDSDVLSYNSAIFDAGVGISGITADMRLGTVIGPDGNTDQIRAIERIYGTNYDDVFLGSGADNRFRGHAGDDTMNGRAGFDTADYSRDLGFGGFQGIDANLASGVVTDAFGSTDTLVSIEAITGTDLRDVLRDNAQDNELRGGDGNDILRVSRGNDDLIGDGGADRFVFVTGNFGDNYIDDFDQSQGDTIMIANATSMADLTITQVNDGSNFGTSVETTWGEIYLNGVTATDLTASDFML